MRFDASAAETIHERPSLYVLGTTNETSGDLVRAFCDLGVPTVLIEGPEALTLLRPGDTALARLDVLQTLDGVEEGLVAVWLLERRGVRVLNRVPALLAAHDKLRTARILDSAGLPHPRTALAGTAEAAALEPPVVVKPRFGSWGRDVYLCRDRDELELTLRAVSERSWFLRHGVLLQEYVPARGHDLRVIAAGGEVAGAAARVAAPGEWRTNVSIGGTLEPTTLSYEAGRLAVQAIAAIGADFMGVDLVSDPAGGHRILELNAAAEFDDCYSLEGRDVYREVALRLGLLREPVEAVA
jgi:[lysine-biosynthesis-protein LysW]---L-2-aminoadipate ligase